MGDTIRERLHSKNILRIKNESGSEDIHYPLFYEGLPDEYKLVAEQTLKESATNREKFERHLKEFMKKEKISLPDHIIIAALRSCKYNMKKSESKVKRLFKYYESKMQMMSQLDDEKIEAFLEDCPVTVLPYRDKHGRAIMATRPTISLDKYSMEDFEPLVVSLFFYLLSYPLTTVCGINWIAESKADSILVYYPILKGVKSYIYHLNDYPIRVGRVDLLNENLLVRFFYNTMRPILPDKITKRLFFNGDKFDSLHKAYHPDILPKEMGGNLEPMNNKHLRKRWLKIIQERRDEHQKT